MAEWSSGRLQHWESFRAQHEYSLNLIDIFRSRAEAVLRISACARQNPQINFLSGIGRRLHFICQLSTLLDLEPRVTHADTRDGMDSRSVVHTRRNEIVPRLNNPAS